VPEERSVDEWVSLLDERVPDEALADGARHERRIEPSTPRCEN